MSAQDHKRARHLKRWRESAEFRAIATRQARKNVVEMKSRPHCGARRKYDNRPCQQPAMANGRCYLHGGKTPRGKNWHVVQLPKDPSKLFRKLKDIERRERKRRERIASMTPEELASYQRWLEACPPGDATKRAAAKVLRKQAVEAAQILRPRVRASDPAKSVLSAQIEALKLRVRRILRSNEGVFG